MLLDLVKKSRSYRRFYEEKEITIEQLKQLIELARLSSSGANRQPLKYILCNSKEKNQDIFDTLTWAGYLKDWDGPIKGERPSAYVIMLRDKSLSNTMTMDEGICAQSIFLGATDMGFGGCFIGAINKPKLNAVLDLSEEFEIALVIALGYPKEEVVLEDLNSEGDIKYYRDENSVHHVPKRSLKDLLLHQFT